MLRAEARKCISRCKDTQNKRAHTEWAKSVLVKTSNKGKDPPPENAGTQSEKVHFALEVKKEPTSSEKPSLLRDGGQENPTTKPSSTHRQKMLERRARKCISS